MNFGVNVFKIESLLNYNNPAKKIDSLSLLDPIDQIKYSINLGIKDFEVVYDIHLMSGVVSLEEKIERMVELKVKYNLTYSVHLPFTGIDLSYPDLGIRKAYSEMMVKVIESCAPLNPELYVIHLTGSLGSKIVKSLGEDICTINSVVQTLADFSRYVVEEIIRKSKIDPSQIAVENTRFPFYLLEKIIYDYGLSICMDAGHLTAGYSGTYTLKSFFEKYQDQIAEIHLHDAYCRCKNGIEETKDHLPLDSGDMNWIDFINYLQLKNFNKRIILEMNWEETLLSLKR